MEVQRTASQREETTEGQRELTAEDRRRAKLDGYVAALRSGHTPAADRGDEALIDYLVTATSETKPVRREPVIPPQATVVGLDRSRTPDVTVQPRRPHYGVYGPRVEVGDEPLIDQLVLAIGKAARVTGEPTSKRGRKASGLRDLSPEAARLVVLGWSIDAVREACSLQKRIAQSNSYRTAPDLVRLLHGDMELKRVWIVEVEEAGFRVAARPVVRVKDDLFTQLVDLGVEPSLAEIAPRFLADVERARIGKMTANYGEGRGGAQSAEPERLVIAMDQLMRATSKLNWQQRSALWGYLVFGLPLLDVGHIVCAGKFNGNRDSLIAAAVMIMEGAFQALEVVYRNAEDPR